MPSLSTLHRDLAKFARYHLVQRAADHPAREEDLGIVPLSFDLDRYVASLHALDGERFSVETAATVRYAERDHPILTVRSRAPAERTLLVLAGVHVNVF